MDPVGLFILKPWILVAAVLVTVSSCRWAECDDKSPTICAIHCRGGSMKACVGLGWMHESGKGVEKDVAKATALYERACQADEALGCANLGWLYRKGQARLRESNDACSKVSYL